MLVSFETQPTINVEDIHTDHIVIAYCNDDENKGAFSIVSEGNEYCWKNGYNRRPSGISLKYSTKKEAIKHFHELYPEYTIEAFK